MRAAAMRARTGTDLPAAAPAAALLLALSLALPLAAGAYPLDAAEHTGIWRLEAQRRIQAGLARGEKMPPGAELTTAEVDLRLAEHPELTVPEADEKLAAALRAMLGAEADRYGIALLDVSDPAHPLYAEHRGDVRSNPGSVGKLAVILGLFRTLADLYPDDVVARERVLRNSPVVADSFIRDDSHEVPIWKPGDAAAVKRPLREGDEANLWSFTDHMLSASSNAAASTVIEHSMLLAHFGLAYPSNAADYSAFFAKTPKKDLSQLLARVLYEPITRSGLDIEGFRQGGFFTATGKSKVPAGGSYATPRELLHYLLLMEQGKLVDPFSSREIKRLLYMTARRIRYASSPALAGAAVYFKSGSLYKCAPEPGFRCGKYMGNVDNFMNSVAVVEAPARNPRLHYLAAVTSNVLRKNSAVEHQTLATRIHRLIESRHPPVPPTTPLPEHPGAAVSPPPGATNVSQSPDAQPGQSVGR